MNKYQEALDYVNKSVCTALSCLGVNDTKTKESLHTLQELVDKEKSPTIEEAKKEWEELGYEWIEDNYFICLKYSYKYAEDKIIIEKHTKKFWKEDGHFEMLAFNFVEHQLLTKTFKALGWL